MLAWMQELFYRHAQQAFADGDVARLRSCADILVQENADDETVWQSVAEALFQTQAWYDAVQWVQRWRDKTSHVDAVFYLARIEAATGLLSLAKKRLQALLVSSPAHNEAAQLLAEIDASGCASLSHCDEFYLAWQAALDSDHHHALMVLFQYANENHLAKGEHQRLAGLVFFRAKHYVQTLNCLASLNEWDGDVTLALAVALLNCGDTDRAEGVIKKYRTKPLPEKKRSNELRSVLNINIDHALTGVQLRIAHIKRKEDTCWSLLRQAGVAHFSCDYFSDAVEAWASASQDYSKLLAFLLAQQERLGVTKSFWTIVAQLAFRCERSSDEQVSYYRQALLHDEKDPLTWSRLGVVWLQEQKIDAAADAFQWALKLDSSLYEVWQHLAILSANVGDAAHANEFFQRALSLAPKNGVIWSNFGNFLVRQRAMQMAVECERLAVRYEPQSATCWNNLAAACLSQHYHLEAKAALEKSLALNPTFVSALSNQARTLGQIGEFDQSLALFDAIPNKDLRSCSSMLFYANYHPDLSSEAIYAIYRRVIDQYFLASSVPPHRNERSASRPLVIGYVSPDFREHPCFHFIAPLLRYHHRSEFKVIAYSDVGVADARTNELKRYADEWRDINGKTDEQVADIVRHDAVDILIDLAGHTSDNRLSLFVKKPAPVQMTWLGFGYTTGIKQIDYFLTDDEMVPPGSESVFSEQPARVSVPCFAYQTPEDARAVVATPALKNGFVTFGSLSRTVRLNHRCLSVWVELLHRVAGSHLLLNSFSFAEPAMVDRFIDYFLKQGITADRLDIAFETPAWPVYERIDIMLDCFPHNSGTTLFEGIFMGVPFITRRDRVSMGRLGATIARGLGCPHWIADNDADYIDKAVAMAGDISALATSRGQRREQLLHSPLCDGNGFTQRVEQVYRQIWTHWCDANRVQETNMSVLT